MKFGFIKYLFIGLVLSFLFSCEKAIHNAIVSEYLHNTVELTVENKRSSAISVEVGSLYDFGTIQPGQKTNVQIISKVGDNFVFVDGLLLENCNIVIPSILPTFNLIINDLGFSLIDI